MVIAIASPTTQVIVSLSIWKICFVNYYFKFLLLLNSISKFQKRKRKKTCNLFIFVIKKKRMQINLHQTWHINILINTAFVFFFFYFFWNKIFFSSTDWIMRRIFQNYFKIILITWWLSYCKITLLANPWVEWQD